MSCLKDTFQADETAHGIVEVIEQLERQQPRHATVAIRERMNASVLLSLPSLVIDRLKAHPVINVACQPTVTLSDSHVK
jgi:hypothetical protein